VVPAIKPAAEMSRRKIIGLLATEGTIRRDYTNQLIRQFAADCQVIRLASQPLVTLAEQKLLGQTVEEGQLQAIVDPLITADVDVVVLGCTHFPWFKEEFQRLYPNLLWLDSGAAIARRVQHILAIKPSRQELAKAQNHFYFTGQSYRLDPTVMNKAGIRFSAWIRL
jgi:glutamate racemase